MAEVRRIGNFELLEKLGQGGMGTVYKARQVSMDRIVALKILPPSFAKRKEFIERFFREARASAKLNHPNIVNGIDVGQDNGLYYFAMEFVDGSSVNTLLKHGAIKEFRCAEIGHDIAQALAHAHQNGILHRDIKPDNILIDSTGLAKLCDLGLARVDSESEEQKGLTQQGQAVGTPHYISPEQAKGIRDLDMRTDLYSLGATLYHMVTGKTMYEGPTSVVIMTKHLTDKAVTPTSINSGVSKGFVTVLARLLAKDRNDRYVSAQHLADDLKRVQNGLNPTNAELPGGKWPFVGGEVTAPHSPVKRVAPVVGTASGVDRSRATMRSVRGTGRYSSVGSTLVPLLIAGGLGIGALVMLSGRNNSSNKTTETPAISKPATETTKSNATVYTAPPAAVKAVPKTSAPATVARNSDADVVGVVPLARAGATAEDATHADGDAGKGTATSVAAGKEKQIDASQGVELATRTPSIERPAAAVQKPEEIVIPKAVAPKSAPGPELAAVLEKYMPMAVECRYQDAADLFKPLTASTSKLDDFDRKLAKAHQDGLNGLQSLKMRVISAIKASPGKFDATGVFKKNISGKMMNADERAIHVADPKVKAEFPLAWKGLPAEDLQKLSTLVLGPLPADGQLGMAVLAYGQNQDALARVRLQNLKTSEAQHLGDVIDARDEEFKAKKRAELNAGAEKLYQEAETALMAGKGDEASKHFAQLISAFGQSEFVQTKQKELEALVLSAKAIQTEGVAIEKGNVALAEKGAEIERRRFRDIIDGVTTGYTGSTGFAWMPFPTEATITLPKAYVLREIRLLLWDLEVQRFYRYNVETSVDGLNFVPIGDHSQGEWRSWQTLTFAPRVAKYIRLHGLYNSANNGFHCVELEAYCLAPEMPAVPKYPSKPPEK